MQRKRRKSASDWFGGEPSGTGDIIKRAMLDALYMACGLLLLTFR